MTMGASRFSLAVTAATVGFILLPLVVTVAISVSDTPFVTFPPHGFTLAWYGKVVTDPDFLTSLRLSLSLAAGVTLSAVLFGVPAGIALRRCVFPGRGQPRGYCCRR
jgi:putative spermidine/putrescine transport system permease protein